MNKVELGDSIQLMKTVKEESIHLILSDIPYGINFGEWDVLHKNTNHALLGSSPAQERIGTVFKTRGKPLNGCLIEGMACPGGCVAGAGTNIPVLQASKEVAGFKAAAAKKIPDMEPGKGME